MKKLTLILTLLIALGASAAEAACVAEYKAKRDNPLRLDQGTMVVQASACTRAAVRGAVEARLRSRGWTLLSIVSVRESG